MLTAAPWQLYMLPMFNKNVLLNFIDMKAGRFNEKRHSKLRETFYTTANYTSLWLKLGKWKVLFAHFKHYYERPPLKITAVTDASIAKAPNIYVQFCWLTCGKNTNSYTTLTVTDKWEKGEKCWKTVQTIKHSQSEDKIEKSTPTNIKRHNVRNSILNPTA